MSTVEKKCNGCGIMFRVPRGRKGRKFCSSSCCYESRIVNPTVSITCHYCESVFKGKRGRKYCSRECQSRGYVGFKHSDSSKAAMSFAKKGKNKVKRIPKTCEICGSGYEVTPKYKNSKLCSEACRVVFMKTSNPMKTKKNREAMSNRVVSEETRKKIAEGTSIAWGEGKFNGVKTGKCHWYSYSLPDGSIAKVQGTWELAFADWLCKNRMKFTAHRGSFKYVLKGRQKYWLPDFYVNAWGSWVDVKCRHFYDSEKFDAIRNCNPGIRIKLMFRKDLEEIGVTIYGKGNKHTAYMQELIQRCRV